MLSRYFVYDGFKRVSKRKINTSSNTAIGRTLLYFLSST